MKKIALMIIAAFMLSGCSVLDYADRFVPQDATQEKSPEAKFCVENGGKVDKKARQGQTQFYEVCTFPSGSQCDLFGFFKGACQPADTSKEKKEAEVIEAAKKWITENAPTFKFDGYDLKHKETKYLICKECFNMTFSFISKNKDYGDRNGTELVSEATNHNIVLTMEKGAVHRAITDGIYDEIRNMGVGKDQERKGTIQGYLKYPGGDIPADFKVCAWNIRTEKEYCTDKKISGENFTGGYGYEIIVPEDRYFVYATTRDSGQGKKAYYSDFVKCGMEENCQSHAPLVVDVMADYINYKVDPIDWQSTL